MVRVAHSDCAPFHPQSVYFVLLFFKIFLWAAGALLFGLWWCQNSLLYIPNPDKTVFKDRQIKYNPEG